MSTRSFQEHGSEKHFGNEFYLVPFEALHEKVLKSCREKQSRYFLEAKCGVGATRSREYMIRPVVSKDCEFCSSKAYVCLGRGCVGTKPPVLVRSQKQRDISKPTEILGKVFKTLSTSCVIARNAGPKNPPSLSHNHSKSVISGRKRSGRHFKKKDNSLIGKMSWKAGSSSFQSSSALTIRKNLKVKLF
jgi:hypothetical protein